MCIGYYNFFPSQSGTKGKEYLKVKKKEDENRVKQKESEDYVHFSRFTRKNL